MLIALASLLSGFVIVMALSVIGRELHDHGSVMLRALGLGRIEPMAIPSRQFRIVQRRRMAPVKLAERHPYRVAA